MEFTLTELKLLSTSLVTEIIRREELKNPSDEAKEKIAMLYDLGARIDDEKMKKFRRLKEEGVV